MARPEIKALDRALAKDGQTVTLRRRIGTGGTFVELPVRTRMSGYKAENISGTGVAVTDSKFIISPSEINAAFGVTWPGAAGGDRWPKIGDFLLVNGVQRRIAETQPVIVGDEAVRIEGRVNG